MKTNLYVLLSTFALYASVNCAVIELQDGVINGTVGKLKSGRLFQQFYGIPYAEPPVGELRFKDPVPIKPWSGIRDGSKHPPKCIQRDFFSPNGRLFGQEDCLYLNVFVPNDFFKNTSRTPVMVGIHGGAFKNGAGSEYTPDYFIEKDVIFVTINYRLGALGNVRVLGMSSNSIHAIKRYDIVGFFGMNNDVISGFGEATATSMLVISGCFRTNAEKILKCLQRIPAEEFQELETRLRVWNDQPGIIFKPIIESNVLNQPFLPQKPTNRTYQNKVPWITGVSSGEGALIVMRVGHADELPLLFRNELVESTLTPQDKKVSKTLVEFWTNFAMYGDPNGNSGEKVWKPVETEDIDLIELQDGVINGSVGKSRSGRLFQQFYGIPYAEPPVGELRFKDIKNTSKTPVIVGIHGGAFQIGSGNDYTPNYFMDKDVIFRSIELPVGALGEICVPDSI
ncbi:Carboxylesterase 5A [Sarracenia purpurea var. burkii]